LEPRGTWPRAGEELLSELRASRGRISLVRSAGPLTATVSSLAAVIGEVPVWVGESLTGSASPPSSAEALATLRGRRLLTELDLLFWPSLRINPLSLLRRLAADGPTVAVWPGMITRRRAVYSEPGRPDHFDAPLRDALVLTPMPTTFPDDVPYELERIPA